MRKKNATRGGAMLMTVIMLAGLLPALPGMSTTVYAAELSVTQFATKDELKTFFDLKGSTVQKVYFGQTTSGNAQTWYIAGSNSDGGLVLMCDLANPLATEKVFNSNHELKDYDNDWGCTYTTKPSRVYSNHYGSSDLRTKLKDLEKDIAHFSTSEQTLMTETMITTKDTKNTTTYTTKDKLYAAYGDYGGNYITVGTNTATSLNGGLRIELKSGPYVSGGEFWLRSPVNDIDSSALLAFPGYDVGYGSVRVALAVVPAFNLNLSSVIFASAAPAASSMTSGGGTLTTSDAMTLRYEPADSSALKSATLAVAEKSAAVSNAPEDSYLVVQKEGNAWAKKVQGTVTVLASEVTEGLTSFADCKVWLETTDTNRITTAVPAATGYEVAITNPADSHITRSTAEGNGAEIQPITAGTAITDVIYQAEEGYYFPDTYNSEGTLNQNGITVTRNDATKITVSGTPIDDVSIALTLEAATEKAAPEAPTVSGGVLVINGIDDKMEYAATQDAATWTPWTSTATMTAGTWYVRYMKTATAKASPATAVTVSDPTYTITAAPGTIDFGAKNEGQTTRPEAQTVEIKNTGNSPVTLKVPAGTSGNYELGSLTAATLAPEAAATFTIQPKNGLAPGTYNETITVTTDKGTTAAVQVTFTVNGALSLTISPAQADILAGQSQTLTANLEGGSRTYTYAWYVGEESAAFAATKEVTVSPAATTTYKVVVSDTKGDTTATATATVTVTQKPVEAPIIIGGAEGKWTKGSKDGLTFRSNAEFSEFMKVLVDDKELAEENYTKKAGSIIVTLKPQYLETLATGKHTLGIVSTNGTAEATFAILAKAGETPSKPGTSANPSSPQTGDGSNLMVLFALLLASGATFAVLLAKRRRTGRHHVK